jgi:hypothetical protein
MHPCNFNGLLFSLFFSKAQGNCAFNYIKKRRNIIHSTIALLTEARNKHKETNPLGIQATDKGAAKKERPLAPASSQRFLSSSACCRIRERLGVSPSNTHLLRRFHIFQAPNMMREFSPFLTIPCTASAPPFHHSKKDIACLTFSFTYGCEGITVCLFLWLVITVKLMYLMKKFWHFTLGCIKLYPIIGSCPVSLLSDNNCTATCILSFTCARSNCAFM